MTSDPNSHQASNVQQAAFWTDVGGPNWVQQQRQFDHMLRSFGERALEALAPVPAETIADIGCGTGTATLALGDAVGGEGRVIGYDISSTMIAAARDRAADHPQVAFRVADVQVDALTGDGAPFDGIYSRFGVMFFEDPVAAFRNVRSVTRPGGRLAFACWQHEERNEWISVPAAIMRRFTPAPVFPPANAPGPFAFRDPERISSILGDAGWSMIAVDPFSAPTTLGGGQGVDAALEQALATSVGQLMRQQVDEETLALAKEAIRTEFAEHADADGIVTFEGNVWIVTASV
jgi:SAM-dependent methyltransferase